MIDLRDRLIARGSNLVVRVGDPATEIANLCATIDKNSDGCSAMKIFAHEETCLEELQMVDSVKSAATCPVDLLCVIMCLVCIPATALFSLVPCVLQQSLCIIMSSLRTETHRVCPRVLKVGRSVDRTR